MRLTALPTAAILLPLFAATAPAQVITGIVTDDATGRPLEGVEVTLLDTTQVVRGRAATRDDGRFALTTPAAGEWLLSLERLGYRPIHLERVEVSPGERVVVEVRMAVAAVPLDPVVVTSRTLYRSPTIQAFYDRMQQGGPGGMGSFISRSDIERHGAGDPTDLFRGEASVRTVPGRVGRGDGLRMSAGCVPAVYIDGSQINRLNRYDSLDDYVTTLSIEGIEIYRGAAQVGRFHDPHGCGLILVWTRRGVAEDAAIAFSWQRLLGVAALIGALLVLR